VFIPISDHGKVVSYEPVRWNEYFNIRDDIELESGTFRIYRRGVEGPLLFFIHGGGFSALTWAVLSATITEQVKCQCLAVDMRGHGDTSCQDDEDLSVDTLSKDVIKIIFAMYPTEAPPIVLVGHSLFYPKTEFELRRSALNSLQGMTAFLRSRPQSFYSLSQAIEWSVRSSQLRNLQSARVSFPGQLKRIETGETATYELESGVALISCSATTESRPHLSRPGTKSEGAHRLPGMAEDEMAEREEADETISNAPGGNSHSSRSCELSHDTVNHVAQSAGPPDALTISSGSPATAPSNRVTDATLGAANKPQYTWRIDLMRTQQFWHEWFAGLSSLFLSIPEPKLLLLAGVDRLDKELTIGQMQGKFQVRVFPKSGHAVQEDAPDLVGLIRDYLVI
ncbi:Protein phosphatase methylesterase, partial [Fasciolopsis buskii]